MTELIVRDWMFALAHPVHGPAICEAAGCCVYPPIGSKEDTLLGFVNTGTYLSPGSYLSRWQTAAICFGVLRVLLDIGYYGDIKRLLIDCEELTPSAVLDLARKVPELTP